MYLKKRRLCLRSNLLELKQPTSSFLPQSHKDTKKILIKYEPLSLRVFVVKNFEWD